MKLRVRNGHLALLVVVMIIITSVNFVQSYGSMQPSVMGHDWSEIDTADIPPGFQDGTDDYCTVTGSTLTCGSDSIEDTNTDYCAGGVCPGDLYVTGNLGISPSSLIIGERCTSTGCKFEVNMAYPGNRYRYFRVDDNGNVRLQLRTDDSGMPLPGSSPSIYSEIRFDFPERIWLEAWTYPRIALYSDGNLVIGGPWMKVDRICITNAGVCVGNG